MIYTDQQLVKKIRKMIVDFEDEVVEFKEARTNYSFKDIGKYFSALGNEANIRGLKEAWLIFGVTNNKEIVGSAYRQDGNLQHLKKEIVGGTNERATFMEIYELNMDGHRIVAFQIPPATRGIPTTWNGAAYAREDESTCPLPMDKVDLIRSQIGIDWSKEIVEGATFEDLDPEAVSYARELFIKKQNSSKKSTDMLLKMSDIEMLNKAGMQEKFETFAKDGIDEIRALQSKMFYLEIALNEKEINICKNIPYTGDEYKVLLIISNRIQQACDDIESVLQQIEKEEKNFDWKCQKEIIVENYIGLFAEDLKEFIKNEQNKATQVDKDDTQGDCQHENKED